jgi:hypothetical protein
MQEVEQRREQLPRDGLVALHVHVLLATYTPSMEISVSREGTPGTV